MQKDAALLTDLYETVMSNCLLKNGMNRNAVFDMYFRKVPDGGGFAIMAGLEQLIDYFNSLKFSVDELSYIRENFSFDESFLKYLKDFSFSCDVWAIPEGTPIFPGEPIVTVKGPVIECLMVETMVLLSINHQSLIATKANRISRAAQNRDVIEFGARRAHGEDASVYGARAAFIGGCEATTCIKAGKEFGIPVYGEMSHAFVEMFDNEYEAFKTYAECYKDRCSLVVDTFNTLKSGIPNAIKVFDEVLTPNGQRPKSVRIDSGDLTYLSKKARTMLDAAGYPDCDIVVSNSLDEYLIRDMLMQGASVECFCVGERLINAASEAVFGGVYKLSAIENEKGEMVSKIKVSENGSKISLPGIKECYRLFDRESGKAIADVITGGEEEINDEEEYTIFDPEATWKRKTIKNYISRKLRVKIFENGKQVYCSPSATDIRRYRSVQVQTLWEEVQRFEKPHKYYVDLSKKLWDLRQDLLEKHSV